MIHDSWTERQHEYPLLVDKVPINFLSTYNEINVSILLNCHLYCYIEFDSYGTSWGTMVTLPSPTTSTVKETSSMTLNHNFLSQQIFFQGNTKYLKLMNMTPTPLVLQLRGPTYLVTHSLCSNQLDYHFQFIKIFAHYWLPSPLSVRMAILSQG